MGAAWTFPENETVSSRRAPVACPGQTDSVGDAFPRSRRSVQRRGKRVDECVPDSREKRNGFHSGTNAGWRLGGICLQGIVCLDRLPDSVSPARIPQPQPCASRTARHCCRWKHTSSGVDGPSYSASILRDRQIESAQTSRITHHIDLNNPVFSGGKAHDGKRRSTGTPADDSCGAVDEHRLYRLGAART